MDDQQHSNYDACMKLLSLEVKTSNTRKKRIDLKWKRQWSGIGNELQRINRVINNEKQVFPSPCLKQLTQIQEAN